MTKTPQIKPRVLVILGAGIGGLPLTHKLLKLIPKVKEGLKVYLVSPNSHFYWNIAAVRGVIPGTIPDDQLFGPIEPGFKKFTDQNFQFVQGKAEFINVQHSKVTMARNDGFYILLKYDQLIVATGSQVYTNLPLQLIGTPGQTLDALHSVQQQIEAAESIVVAGSGLIGVGVAGELAAHYGTAKKITLIVNGNNVLHFSKALPEVCQKVERNLLKLGVELVINTHVLGAREDAAGPLTLTLSGRGPIITDLYLLLFGTKVNTKFIPPRLLDPAGNLNLGSKMRVLGTEMWEMLRASSGR